MTINSMASNSLSNDMLRLSTAKRTNSAADDATGLSISEALKSTSNGLKTGIDNTENMGNLVNTAEGGLSGASDMLHQMRDLAVQAGNGTLSREDRAAIQAEIEGLKGGIQDALKNTQYNSMNLLDGSFTNQNTASNADGTGMEVNIRNTSLESLGIADFDVTSSFDLEKIDNAIENVSETRSSLGAISNALSHVSNANNNAYVNQVSSLSRIQDADMAETIANMNKNKALEQLSMFSVQKQNEQLKNRFSVMF